MDSGRGPLNCPAPPYSLRCSRTEKLGVNRKGEGFRDSPKDVTLPGLALALRVYGSATRRSQLLGTEVSLFQEQLE